MFFVVLGQTAFIGLIANHSIEVTIFFALAFLAGYFVKHLFVKNIYTQLAGYKLEILNHQTKIDTIQEENLSLKQLVQRQNSEMDQLYVSKNSNTEIIQFKKQLSQKDEEIVLLRSELVMLKEKEIKIASKLTSDYISIKKDDLKIIEGIGPKIEKMLFDAKIFTYEDLKNQNPEKIKFILIHAGGERYKIHDPQTWPIQAELAYLGKWNELKEYQRTKLKEQTINN